MDLQTADDHFNYGVERLNARDMEVARRHLDRALALEPDGEHILFTLALCCGLAGDGAGACENLKRAIELEPKNRILARQDPEFSALAQQFPALRALLAPENAERLSDEWAVGRGRGVRAMTEALRVVSIGGGNGLSALLTV